MRRILGRVPRAEFVGRTSELERLVAHPNRTAGARGMLLLLAPSAGVSELLRQAYDELFEQRGDVVPIYFALSRSAGTVVSTAIEFLNNFLLQFIAYRRNEPGLCNASLTLTDLLQLAPPVDHEWIDQLVQAYNRERFGNDDKSLVRLCLSAAQRVPPQNGRPFLMIDSVELAAEFVGELSIGAEIIKTLTRSDLPFALAGLRRQILNLAHNGECDFESTDILRIDKLSESEARVLVEHIARRHGVSISEESRDLLVQQFDRNPFYITALFQAAREKNSSLESYLDCERLYVNDLMGGQLNHHFSSLLEEIAPEPESRRSLISFLFTALVTNDPMIGFETWRNRLRLETDKLEKLLQELHVQELVNWNGVAVEITSSPIVWQDYLQIRFRLDVAHEPRALVIADAMANSLKRAPNTMAHHYRRAANLGLNELLGTFDCQLVPAVLFHYDRFGQLYKGNGPVEEAKQLDTETELFRLPQVFHVASCFAFNRGLGKIYDEERCVVAHGFEAGTYLDSHEIIWLVAEIESKLEVDLELAELWRNRLEALAAKTGFTRSRVWLISNEGFSNEACAILNQRGVFTSSRHQVTLLTTRIVGNHSRPKATSEADEYVMIVPMGDDNELLAAGIVEQIARRLDFRPEAVNQIKTAIVEACINASEHSYSPDRKIYQRFRVESDRLVVTVSSRGVVPGNLQAQIVEQGTVGDVSEDRRGWGLKLIKTLMDEVEFERVDEGTSLRMTKYLRNRSI